MSEALAQDPGARPIGAFGITENGVRTMLLRQWLREPVERALHQVLVDGSVPEPLARSALFGRASFLARKGRLWSATDPWFDWWGVTEALWDERLDDYEQALETAEKAVRRLAFQRAPGQRLFDTARGAFLRAGIHMSDDVVIAFCRSIAQGGGGRGPRRVGFRR